MGIPADSATLLAPTVRERSRVLAPCVLAALLFYVIGAGPLGIRPPLFWYVISWIPVAMEIALVVALRRVSDRWIHLASAGALCCPMLTTFIAFYATRDPIYVLLLITAIGSAGVLLHTPYAIAMLVAGVGAGMWLVLASVTNHAAMYVAALVTAAAFAIVIHVLMRRAIIRVELMRRTEVEHRERLAAQIVELERAEAERASLAEQLVHAQRMEAVGTLAAGLAHDMNNVLASISGFASLLLDEVDRPALVADVQQIVLQTSRGAELTRGLLAFSRRGQYRKQVVRAAAVVDDVLPLLRRTLPKSITIETDLAFGDTCIEADPVHLHQVLVNLGLNAADAMDGTGTLAIRGSVVDRGAVTATHAAGRYVQIVVTDTGRGLDAATKLRVFEPFFTTKPQGQGTGLGLAIVWGIVQAHGGVIDVESEVGAGTAFRILIPVTESTCTVREAAAAPAAARHHPATVLVIDDEHTLRVSTKRLLERSSIAVIVAENGREGVEAFLAAAGAIELVILDMGMPVMGGAECFRQIRAHSDVPILIATGYAEDHDAQELVAAGAALIEKPYTSDALRREVNRLLRRAQP